MKYERLIDGLADYVIFLPFTLTMGSKHRVVRMLGLMLGVIWIAPAAALCGLPLCLVFGAKIVMLAWKEPNA